MSGLSRKALRVYEDYGLLLPVHIHPENRYRFYAPSQLRDARIIQVLRMMEVSMDRIQLLLDSTDPLQDLNDLWVHREKQHVQHRAFAQYLHSLFEAQGGEMFEVHTRQVDGEYVATLSGQVYAHEAPGFISSSIAKIRRFLEQQQVEAREIDWTICHEGPSRDAKGSMEVCVPFVGSLLPGEGISLKHEPPHQEAYIRLRKEQCQPAVLMQAYDAGQRWLQEQGKVPILGSREVYFADWSTVADHEEAFDLAFPYHD
ncbi:MerR family transcriptional regulator [Deinococcus cellulosilyticus NBRC 106333 = KACC 11606]|uniref:MerR family transcriptional regulator n=1 Tax=Deinococcus cellulosilyticus (strain DSM 18568 / NBRC 106333 / KACC 11606 / 5516J-15) TaxID=1223518 RepID=A0A511N1V6_DEIC1|nr:MerR family transcriptional regulator [Deinococcus cellulosilyticus NBRC 106333 = KACC 11606]